MRCSDDIALPVSPMRRSEKCLSGQLNLTALVHGTDNRLSIITKHKTRKLTVRDIGYNGTHDDALRPRSVGAGLTPGGRSMREAREGD